MNARTLMVLASATGILLAGSVAVTAAPGGKGGPGARLDKMLERVDTDQSGTVSFQEFSALGNERFAAHDADGDGFITPEERELAKAAKEDEREQKGGKRADKMEKRMQGRLGKIDTDGDGIISRAEHDNAQQQRFASLDQDGDGEVTKDEFVTQMMKRGKGGKRDQTTQ